MLKLLRQITCPDWPYSVTVLDDGRRIAVGSPAGAYRLFDNDLRQLDAIELGARVRAGSFAFPIPGTFSDGCRSLADPSVLCVASCDGQPTITAIDLDSGRCIAEAPLPDRGGGGYLLVGHPEGEAMAVVAYSGQSEEWMF